MDRRMLDELMALHARITPRFARPEVRELAGRYLAGLLAPVQRRNGWQMARQIGDERPDGVQRLLNKARWHAELLRNDLRNYLVKRIGDPTGVLMIVETGFHKKGAKSVGVAQQYNPSSGRVENCQVGLFLAYASLRGWAFIDRALYLPKGWVEDEKRRREAGVPEKVGYASKSELARAMIERAFEAHVPACWVAGGQAYGKDEGLRRWLRGRGKAYVLLVERSDVLTKEVDGVPTWRWSNPLGPDAFAWEHVAASADSEGPRGYEWARGRLPHQTAAGWAQWLLVRRSLTRRIRQKLVYYRAYGPEETSLAELARVANTSRPVAEGLERAKREVGLDQYEVRRWEAWHRHVTLCLLAHAASQVARADGESERPPSACCERR